MRFSYTLFLAFLSYSDAFVAPSAQFHSAVLRSQNSQPVSFALNAMSQEEIASLKAQASKARAEANRLAKVRNDMLISGGVWLTKSMYLSHQLFLY